MTLARLLVALALLSWLPTPARADRLPVRSAGPPALAARLAAAEHPLAPRPLQLEANRGQLSPEVRFLARAPGYRVALKGGDPAPAVASIRLDRLPLVALRPGGLADGQLDTAEILAGDPRRPPSATTRETGGRAPAVLTR